MRNPLSAILQLADGILGSLDVAPSQDPISLPADTINMMVDAAQTIVSRPEAVYIMNCLH
jgi:hypothetical protein